MPYSKEHKEQSRERIVESASQLFSRKGYDSVSIDDLMKEAGLTRGAFYNHFKNKNEVYAEAIIYAALKSPFTREKTLAIPTDSWFDNTIGRYLSREHLEQEPSPCPLAFLVTDIVKRESSVRSTYTRVYKNLIRLLKGRFRQNNIEHSNETIMAVTAMMIGGVALARALDDKKVADKLMASCRQSAREMLNIGE